MLLFGWLLLIGGVVGLLRAVQSRGSHFFWLVVVVAALNIAAGVVILRRPDVAAEALTMFAALLFLTGGVFRLAGSLVVRGPQFGWTLLQGLFGLALGVLVLAEWPSSSQYVIGTFFSLSLLFDGLSLISTGMGGRASSPTCPTGPKAGGTPPSGPVESGHGAPSAGRVRSIRGILRSGTGLGAGHSQHSDCGSHRGPGRRRDRGRGPEHG